ncbi:MAG: hypothetical protein V1897_01190, partial [Pseudomonadota bacterium]
AYLGLVQPRFRKALHDEETLRDCQIDKCDYETFREKCHSPENFNNPYFVHMIVSQALANSFSRADKSKKKERVDSSKWRIETVYRELQTDIEGKERKALERFLETEKKWHSEINLMLKQADEIYQYICLNLVRKLLSEKPRFEPI